MSPSETDSKVVPEDEKEEGQLYQFIFELNTGDDKKEKKKVQIPPSPGHTPVHLKMNAERDGSGVKATLNIRQAQTLKGQKVDNRKGPDLDALNNEQKMPKKAGADVLDYFNYGFDEKSWMAYCTKQKKLSAAKKMVQEEEESCSACSSSGSTSTLASSPGHTPVHLKMNAERDGSGVKATLNIRQAQTLKGQEVDNRKGPDLDALNNEQKMPILMVNAEEKPWRKASADVSDYFNYGFDEKSWMAYCTKQKKLSAANRKLNSKKMVQEEEESYSACSSSGSTSILASRYDLINRQSSATTDVAGGQPWPRVTECQRLSVEGNKTQVVTEVSPKEDRITSYHLPPPSNVKPLFEYTSPPYFFYRRDLPPFLQHAAVDSGYSKGIDALSAPLYLCSSGVSPLIPWSLSSRAGWIDTAKAWEKCDKDRSRSREHGHGKDSRRGRESCSSSYNSGEERVRHRDTMERRHKHHSFQRFSGEKEQQQSERRHRHKDEGWQKSPRSRSSSSSGSRKGWW